MNTSQSWEAGLKRRKFSDLFHLFEHSYAAWAILAVSLLLTFGAWLISSRMVEYRMQDRFEFKVNGIVEDIEERMLEYEQVLRGGIGLFASSDDVTRGEWREFVKHLEIDQHFPGLQGMGVAMAVAPDDVAKHEEIVRAEGFEDYQIKPDQKRDFYTSIVYLEPFDWRNQRAFGYDMYSNATRREAMDKAIETGMPAMSGMVTLVQETEQDVQRGWLLYLPMYTSELKLDGNDPQDKKRSRDSLSRFVYGAFRAADLMKGVIEESCEVKFEIYDAQDITVDRLLYDSDEESHFSSSYVADYRTKTNLEICGRNWTVVFESCPDFVDSANNHQSTLIAFCGLTVDVLLFIVIAIIGQQKRKAVQIAKSMTKDLRYREELIGGILDNASEAIVTVNDRGIIELANNAAQRMFGLSLANDKQQFYSFFPNRVWTNLVEKKTLDPDTPSASIVRATSADGRQFKCLLGIGQLFTNGKQFHVVVAKDETNRIESERKLSEIHNELVSASQAAAKVEMANGVLHNVGNIVNSINVSTYVIKKQLETNSVSRLDRVCDLIDEHQSNLGEFFVVDERGKRIPEYLRKIYTTLSDEFDSVDSELQDLLRNVAHVTEVITSQQTEARDSTRTLVISPEEILEDAITANKAKLANNDIEIIRVVGSHLPKVRSQKHKIIQILVNLLKNACDALEENHTNVPKVVIRVGHENDNLVFEVTDNGIGIPQEKLESIFSHGFTTKESGHGFGLHSSQNAAKQLGGNLVVTSDGIGCGAKFKLYIPTVCNAEEPADDRAENSIKEKVLT